MLEAFDVHITSMYSTGVGQDHAPSDRQAPSLLSTEPGVADLSRNMCTATLRFRR